MLETHEILAFKHDIAKVKQEHSETAMLVLLYMFFLLRLKHNINIFMIETSSTVMQLFKGSNFSMCPASRHF